jgi:hypothetical protein
MQSLVLAIVSHNEALDCVNPLIIDWLVEIGEYFYVQSSMGKLTIFPKSELFRVNRTA